MRPIDADELKKDDEITTWLSNDAVRTGKTLKMFSELFIRKIDEQPTIQAVPIDVLNKLKAEIATLQNRCYALTKGAMCEFCKFECKYKAESRK